MALLSTAADAEKAAALHTSDTAKTPRIETAFVKIALTILAIAAVAAGVIYFIFGFVQEARERDLQAWQMRLGIVADSRTAAVDAWVAQQHKTIRSLAENEALKLYLTRISMGPQGAGAPEQAEAEYLGNLLTVTAARTGFKAAPTGPAVRANVKRIGVAGLALMDMNGRILVSTAHFPPIEASLQVQISRLPKGKKAIIGPFKAPSGHVSIAVLEPIMAIQSDRQIGMAIGIKPIAAELFPALKQPGDVSKTQESVLVRRKGAVIEYLSPLADGAKPMERSLAANTPNLAAAFAIESPGGFDQRRDYRGNKVLVTGRALKTAPWFVVQKIDRAEAMGPSDSRTRRLLLILLFGVGVVAAATFGLWRHGASRRAKAAALRFQDMAERFEHQRDFLGLLTDSQPNAIFIADQQSTLRFANTEAAQRAGMERQDMIGKTLAAVLGPNRSKVLQRLNRAAEEEGHQMTDVHRLEIDGEEKVYQTKHIPLEGSRELPRGVLVIEEDVTVAVTEREGRLRGLRDLVGTLVALVDRRDPNAANHSSRVAFVSRSIAQEMDLPPDQCEAAEFAGRLMNLGKIMVPSELLTKKGKLTAKEIKLVREGIHATADLLEGVAFDGPVVGTLREVHAHWDGRGHPKDLKGERILITARIVAVANNFVALTSPRAHRAGLDIDKATDVLLGAVGKEYDRKVVTALINFLDNRGGRALWARFDGSAAS